MAQKIIVVRDRRGDRSSKCVLDKRLVHSPISQLGKISMRVLTRTFPPNSNPNYGGILQAWALQQVMNDLGVESYVDSTRSNTLGRGKAILRSGKQILVDRFVPAKLVPQAAVRESVKRAANSEILSFARNNIRMKALYKDARKIDFSVIEEMDAFVVGSDQVWRPAYVDVPSYLFDFLPVTNSLPRVAYSASFGVEDLTSFSPELVEKTVPLAQRLSAISVREETGVELCRKLWGVKAERVVDPTLLLDAERYRTLSTSFGLDAAGKLASYVLDASSEVQKIADEYSRRRLSQTRQLYPPLSPSVSEVRRNPGPYRKPRVEEWIGVISHSDAVITDSYHGTLFSILFNRPFLVSINALRGATRFQNILSLLGLEDRVAKFDGQDVARLEREIDWQNVNERIMDERERGLDFLRRSLN